MSMLVCQRPTTMPMHVCQLSTTCMSALHTCQACAWVETDVGSERVLALLRAVRFREQVDQVLPCEGRVSDRVVLEAGHPLLMVTSFL
eukprot:3428271-Rhodomonas_salina.2